MSETPFVPGEDSALAPMRRPNRGRVLTLLSAGVILVAAAGVATGVVLERAVLSHHGDHGPGRGGPGRAGGPGGEGRGSRGAMHERFGRDLGLTTAQEAKIDSIFASHRPAIDSARAESEPKVRAIIEQTRREVDSVLTPAQREKMHARMKREHPPGDSLHPGGLPPAPRM
jgi:Spy/CpxP family protein refolding chaperone